MAGSMRRGETEECRLVSRRKSGIVGVHSMEGRRERERKSHPHRMP